MKLEKGNWKFDETVVPIFDQHVRQSVPMYDEFHNLITNMASWYLTDGTNVYDVGTSTGKVLKNLNDNYSKMVTYIGVDNSPDMIEKLKSEELPFSIMQADVTENFKFENASFITSVLTIQFIEESKRQLLINNIYNGLNKGSAFVMVEKVVGNNARFNEIWTELYHELKLKNGLSEKHVFEKSRAIRGVMKPYTIDENLTLLNNAGFRDIDIFFKWCNFVGFIAIK